MSSRLVASGLNLLLAGCTTAEPTRAVAGCSSAAPGPPGCVQFVADRSGVYDVEAHPDLLLVQLEVR